MTTENPNVEVPGRNQSLRGLFKESDAQ